MAAPALAGAALPSLGLDAVLLAGAALSAIAGLALVAFGRPRERTSGPVY